MIVLLKLCSTVDPGLRVFILMKTIQLDRTSTTITKFNVFSDKLQMDKC